jgi:hypothetical protein
MHYTVTDTVMVHPAVSLRRRLRTPGDSVLYCVRGAGPPEMAKEQCARNTTNLLLADGEWMRG